MPKYSFPIDVLVARVCQTCNVPMYIHFQTEEVAFTNCEPALNNLKVIVTSEFESSITAKRSTKVVRCQTCKSKHLILGFEEVKDGVSKSKESNGR